MKKYPRPHTLSTMRHESCKFRGWIGVGTSPSIRACENTHKRNGKQVKPGECLVCEWYSAELLDNTGKDIQTILMSLFRQPSGAELLDNTGKENKG